MRQGRQIFFGRAGRTGQIVAGLCLVGIGLFVAAGRVGGQAAQATSKPTTASQPTSASQPTRFSVATYNINFGNPDLPTILATIKKAQTDIVCLQETNAASEAYLRKNLDKDYPFMKYHTASAAGGLAILSKTKLTDIKVLPNKFGYFATLTARTELSGGTITIASIHLFPTVPEGNTDIAGFFALFKKTESIRMKEITDIHENMHKNLPTSEPVLMAGDFNSPPDLTVAAFMSKKGFVDSLAAANAGAAGMSTWHWNWKGQAVTFRLDYIFHNNRFKTHASKVIASEASDHNLVVSQLSIEKPTSQPASQP